MIQVTVKRQEKQIESVEISGHAESGPYGYDLVCAGVSAVSIGAVNAVMELSTIDLKVEQGGNGGYLKVAFPALLRDKETEIALLLLEGMLVSLRSIENEYGEFIRIDDK